MKWLTRYSHRLGFGIHSPYAFRIVGEVVRAPYRYYAYPDIKRVCASRKERHSAFMLHRLVGRTGIPNIYFDSIYPDSYATAVKYANSKIRILKNAETAVKTLMVVNAKQTDISNLNMLFRRPLAIVYGVGYDERDVAAVVENYKTGLLLLDSHKFLFFNNTNMAFLSYTVQF
jgi:hypothetical protein